MSRACTGCVLLLLLSSGLPGCSDEDGGPVDGSIPADGSTSGMDGATAADGSAGSDGSTAADGAAGGGDGGTTECRPAPCGEQMYQCGNCLDDDRDGLTDAEDPDCVGACDNNEGGYELGIPGGEVGICPRDCYYDTNQGRGECAWDIQCDDTLSTAQACRPAGPAQCPDTQNEDCRNNCAPIVPNGCDCFGCCELPSGSGQFVWLGSNVDGAPTCTFDDIDDPTRCFPCVPVGGVDGDDVCYNPCGRCELCLGRDPSTIPDDCFPPPPGDAGAPGDGGSVDYDGGTPATCDDGRQACGLPGQPPCPEGDYCLTGCCTYFG